MLPEQEEPVAPVKGAFGQQFLNGANIRSNFTIISFKYAYGQAVLRFLQMLYTRHLVNAVECLRL